jgi:hypothetical protein
MDMVLIYRTLFFFSLQIYPIKKLSILGISGFYIHNDRLCALVSDLDA